MTAREIILTALEGEGSTPADLAERLGWRRASVRAAICRLKARGVAITVLDPGDGSGIRYIKTRGGRAPNPALLMALRELSDRELDELVYTVKAERLTGIYDGR